MKYSFGIILIVFFGCIHAQKPFYYLNINNDTIPIDTLSLKGVEVFGIQNARINLGNQGTPDFALNFQLSDYERNDYSLLAHVPLPKIRRYNVAKPVTEAKYVLGTGQEQLFTIFHTQNFNRNANFSLGLDKVNSHGYYLNQATNNTHVYLNAYGNQMGKVKYAFELNFNYQNLLSGLNGGLEDDSVFINDSLDLRNRALLNVNLPHASHQKSQWTGSFEHGINLFGTEDSTNNVKSNLRLTQSVGYLHQSRNYYDSLLSITYYDNIFEDSSITDDDVVYQQWNGNLGLQYNYSKEYLFTSRVYLVPSWNRFAQGVLDTSVLDLELKGSLGWNLRNMELEIKGEYLVNDAYERKDYSIDGRAVYRLSPKHRLEAEVHWRRDRPQLDLLNYTANNVSWTNTFEKTEIHLVSLSYVYQKAWKHSVTVDYFDLKNPVYFAYDRQPEQVSGFGQIIKTEIKGEGELGKRWDLAYTTCYQYFGEYDVFRMPKLFLSTDVAYRFKFFKNKMDLAFGARLSYFTPYESKDFDPVSGQFYIGGTTRVGRYPYADIFIKGRVQRATFFIMTTHPHQGLLGYNYFNFPNYPAQDRVFRIGLSWLFVN